MTLRGFKLQPARGRNIWQALVCLLSSWVIAPGAYGQSAVILHEYIPPEPAEDLALGTVTPSGKMPAAIRTPSGLVGAPDPFRDQKMQADKEPTYGPPASPSPHFQIDGVTSDPGTLHYHEPFRPSIAPFKRLRAFDAVNEDFELVVRDPSAHEVALGGSPEPGQDEFFGDITVSGRRAIPIPSVSAGMHVLAAELRPPVAFQLAVDSAENWYFVAPQLVGEARLILQLAASRSAFSPEVTVNSYSSLASALPAVPAAVVRAAAPVLEQIGISRVNSPTLAVRAMVAYFRGFTPSNEHLKFAPGRELYQNLSLLKRGVCRHRAYAFVVTSLALGIPARMVHNEAHAWVEVFDGSQWHRIDLGGAAPGFHFDGEVPQGAPYRMPKDSYEWPARATPATESRVDTSEQTGMTQVPSDQAPGLVSSQQLPAPQTAPPLPQRTPSNGMDAQSPALADSAQPELAVARPDDVSITFSLVSASKLHRGDSLVLEGRVKSPDRNCPPRLDFTLRNQNAVRALGSTLADDRGYFRLQTTVPSDLRAGRYEIDAARAEAAACADSHQ